MRAGFLTGVRAVEIRKIPDARSEHSDEAIIRVAPVRLCGTDLELYHGTSNYLRNKRTTCPHLFGHEWIGTIEIPLEISQGKHLKPGAIVTENTMIACLPGDPCRSGHKNLCERLREVGLYGHPGTAAELLTIPAHTLTVIDEEADAVPHPEYVLIEPPTRRQSLDHGRRNDCSRPWCSCSIPLMSKSSTRQRHLGVPGVGIRETS
jgi:possible L-threonine 3-dehydrogenase